MRSHKQSAGAVVAKVLIGGVYLGPLLWMLLTALKSQTQVLREPNAVFFTPTLDTFKDVWGSSLGAIGTSLLISALATALVLILAVPAAFALSRRPTRWWTTAVAVVMAVLLVLQMIPQPMTVIPLYSVLARFGLLGSVGGLILADAAFLLPFGILIIRPFAMSIPEAIYEAAEMDGASRFAAFRKITVPMMRNGIFTLGAVIFIQSWGEFVYAINFLPQGSTLPVSGLLAQQNTTYAANWNNMMALALITSIPLLVVFLIAQKKLIAGLSMGSVK